MSAPLSESRVAPAGSPLARVVAGRFLLPAWRAPSGCFKNISPNTLAGAWPSAWGAAPGDSSGPFANWSGGVFAPDFGLSGGYVVHGSGHLSVGTRTWAGTWVFDLYELQWVGRNVPSEPIIEGGAANGYFESTETATAGHTYPPHTYDGLIYQSTANGGGPDGSLIRNCMPGSAITYARVVHQFDLSSAIDIPVRVLADNTVASSYPQSALDEARGGYWIAGATGFGGVKFVKFSDWSVTQHAAEYGTYGDNSMVLCKDGTREYIVCMGRNGSGGVNFGVFVCPLSAGVPTNFTQIYPTGTPPVDKRCGGQWSEILKCIVSYEADGSYTLHKLVPPSGSLTSGEWVWESVVMTAVDGAVPSDTTTTANGAWGRMIEIPSAKTFLWADGVGKPVQSWTLPGMD